MTTFHHVCNVVTVICSLLTAIFAVRGWRSTWNTLGVGNFRTFMVRRLTFLIWFLVCVLFLNLGWYAADLTRLLWPSDSSRQPPPPATARISGR